MSTDVELVQEFLKTVAGLSTYEASDVAEGITQTDVSKWRRSDWKRLTAAKQRALRAFLDQPEIRKRLEAGDPAPIALADGEQRRVTAWVMGLGEAGENTPRKLEGLTRYEKTLAAFRQPVPDWLYELRARVEAGEL